jgi:hypothetical protein
MVRIDTRRDEQPFAIPISYYDDQATQVPIFDPSVAGRLLANIERHPG